MAFERADRGAAASLRSPRFLPVRVDHLRAGRNHSSAEAMGLQIPPTPARQLCFSRNLSPEFSSTDTLLAVDLDPPASFVANHSSREYFLHWRPIGLNPTRVVAAVAAGGDADLRKLEPRAATHLGDIEDRDGIVVRPPACRAPGLNDLLVRLEDEIDAGQMRSPSSEFAAHLLADLSRLV